MSVAQSDRQLALAQKIIWGVLAVAFVYGLYRVIALWWVCDDAFISFRYARNLVEGHGLVFNAGERVEGYTNFLWTIIIALGMLVKLDPVKLSVVLGAICYLCTAGLLVWSSHRLAREDVDKKALFVPVAALSVLVMHDYHVFATSGLETSWTTMLITLGFALLVVAQTPRTYLFAGLVLAAAAMSRPDALLFYVVAVPFVMVAAKPMWRNLIWFAAPLLLIYVPYWLLRYNYYGYPFPNTYYAKSANLPYYSQGLTYLWLFVKTYYVLLLVPVAMAVGLFMRRHQIVKIPFLDAATKGLVLAILFVMPYSLYVVRSGGDFMFARFWIPIIPVAFFTIEMALRPLLNRYRWLPFVGLVIPLAVLLRIDPYTETRSIDGVAYEPYYYPRSWVQHAEEVGKQMKPLFEGTDARIAFWGMYAVYAYYSEVPVAIESNAGLTDTFIAHQQLAERGRPGHEKQAPLSYLVARKVNFGFRTGIRMKTFTDTLTHVRFGDFDCYLIVYDNALMQHLRQMGGVEFVDFPSYLDQYIATMGELSNDDLERAYHMFRLYYFDINHDPARQKPFLDRLGNAAG